ncbi:hypothetical protein DFJ64_2739 [Thermasporomyces composti]|uniref:Uncharacterized protein n=1 Tax=Thermasporomyces composti TaxID=696763 RepID=A0A3D9VDX1_THECX|nr:hypothetical protein DFJ64_2739 [Thermasporomyces composti]
MVRGSPDSTQMWSGIGHHAEGAPRVKAKALPAGRGEGLESRTDVQPGGVAGQAGTASAPVFDGSTGIPGPMVVDSTTLRMYRPLAADGLSRITSSSAAL